MSGYLVKIEVFIPCEPRDPTSMADAAQMIEDLHKHGIRILHGNGMSPTMPAKIGEPRWVARRKSASQGLPHGEGTTQGAPEPGQAPQPAGSGADLEMPGFLKRG